jgi:hypothetical protein
MQLIICNVYADNYHVQSSDIIHPLLDHIYQFHIRQLQATLPEIQSVNSVTVLLYKMSDLITVVNSILHIKRNL